MSWRIGKVSVNVYTVYTLEERSVSENIKSFVEFYPYYLGEHRNGRCRQLHVFGSTMALVAVLGGAILGSWQVVGCAALAGYGPAWIGHYFFEKNRPATFRYPLWSFVADWVMFGDIIRGRVPLGGELEHTLFERRL